MTLRTRLVVALVALSTVGLGVFGVASLRLYQRSLEQQLDQDLASNATGQGGRLFVDASQAEIDPDTCAPAGAQVMISPFPAVGSGPTARAGGSLDTYAELRSAAGKIVACALPPSTEARPDLPEDLAVGPDEQRYLTVGSAEGSGTWRVLVRGVPSTPATAGIATNGDVLASTEERPPTLDGATVITAVPTSGVGESLARLLRIEIVAAACLLTALGIGAWLILRRGLRPLEEMAGAAATITAGDLSQRVDPGDERTEVGQLGTALNTMLDGIEASFQEREATEQRLRQFLADASHELRTPLTSIQGFAELFRIASDGGPTDLERLDLPVVMQRIEQDAGRMKTLVEDLLLLARLDAPQATEPVPLDLAVVAAEACGAAAELPSDRTITLDAPGPVPVEGVGDHLHRAIVNLLANAAKHTASGTAIDVVVAADAPAGLARITVRDHGDGLSDDALAHVFDRFWQADPARAGAGSGLGLSIVAGIAAEHRGRTTAANAPDGGAAFTIELPLAAPAAAAAAGAVVSSAG